MKTELTRENCPQNTLLNLITENYFNSLCFQLRFFIILYMKCNSLYHCLPVPYNECENVWLETYEHLQLNLLLIILHEFTQKLDKLKGTLHS